MFVVCGLPHDPADHERVIGWAVLRPSPWHLAGVYPTEYAARKKLEIKGDGYQIQLGSYRLGSQDFRAFTFEL
ncbi:hypothetical protein FQN13_19695 [Salmonella enterica]|uniref:Uncharacterized protein n=1 Tax=Salmonella enterica TaxID=28901 RepID=A0A5Y7LS58_SALER|nr:hypothetical protein [Salmonella enterica]EBA7102531.1 hypothetical protein [Salmonella enterica]EBC4801370.1 hypothetical protein [Salmonella enterica]ECH2049671.1 hypothetical protein [Salmonella enterica]ECJ8805334.1 hypothetical protein [Salmonella enterica]